MKSVRKPSSISSGYFPALAAATLGFFALGVSATSEAALRAQLERDSVQVGDTLTLSIESEGMQSGDRPNLTPLGKDFDVLGTSSSSETTFVNGNRSDRTRWLVRLQPRHTGTIDIPPITVGSEHTAPLELKVTQAPPQASNRAARHVFLEIEAAPAGKAIYVQQQVPYTVRLYYDDTIQTGDLSAPEPANAIVEQLGEEKHYTATHDGREYNVIERRYAIAPEKSGALHIPPATFRGSAVIAQDHPSDADPGDDLMKRFLRDSPLANDPFFKGNLGAGMEFGEEEPVTARGQEIALDVQPRPAAALGNWLPAEQITLHDDWQDNPPQFKIGEPVTRTITIEAKGLTASQIPPLSFAQPANARLYPEMPDNQSRTDGNTIFGISKQSVTYIPTAQGRLDIPPVELAWWNTRGNIQDRAVLPAREFNVAPGAIEAQSNAAPSSPAGVATQAGALTAPMTADHPGQNASLMERMWNRWPWFAGGLALLAMILPTILIRRSRRVGPKVVQRGAPSASVPQRRSALRALHRACFANDGHAAAQALLDLARAEWPDDPPRGLSALAARLEAGGVEIVSLDRTLYGTHGSRWQGAALWHVFHRGLQPKRSKTWREDDGLEALYR